jgi:hypothetical protein
MFRRWRRGREKSSAITCALATALSLSSLPARAAVQVMLRGMTCTARGRCSPRAGQGWGQRWAGSRMPRSPLQSPPRSPFPPGRSCARLPSVIARGGRRLRAEYAPLGAPPAGSDASIDSASKPAVEPRLLVLGILFEPIRRSDSSVPASAGRARGALASGSSGTTASPRVSSPLASLIVFYVSGHGSCFLSRGGRFTD